MRNFFTAERHSATGPIAVGTDINVTVGCGGADGIAEQTGGRWEAASIAAAAEAHNNRSIIDQREPRSRLIDEATPDPCRPPALPQFFLFPISLAVSARSASVKQPTAAVAVAVVNIQ